MSKSEGDPARVLDEGQVESFIRDGFVRLDGAFPWTAAAACRARLWHDLETHWGCVPDDPSSWTEPVIRLGPHDEPPFEAAANTPRLGAAFDRLVGPGRWRPRTHPGFFAVRFPHPDDPGDTGWHVDASFSGPDSEGDDYKTWWVDIASRDRALLLLFLFSDVGPDDAPTRIKVGSHLAIARRVAAAGEGGLRSQALDLSGDWPEALATGAAGTVYLCHPFLVHAAQAHRGTRPRFLSQPPLPPREPLRRSRPDAAYSPAERAIRLALQVSGGAA